MKRNRNIAVVSSDHMPLLNYIFHNKFKLKLSFLFVEKFKIALITSEASEARKDIHNCLDRYPKFEIRDIFVNLYNPDDIAKAITEVDADGSLNAILMARGGTVKVDIFNEYPILNAIYKSKTLVISAIGHASCNPLSNIVADISEDTPSSAARYIAYKYENYRKNKQSL